MAEKGTKKDEEFKTSQEYADEYTAMVTRIKRDADLNWADDIWIRFLFDDKWKMLRKDNTRLAHYVEDGKYQYSIDNNLVLYRGAMWTVAWECSRIDRNSKITVFRSANEDSSIPIGWRDSNVSK
jgi:hypothetical protein